MFLNFQTTKMIWEKLPVELWDIVGSYIFPDIFQYVDSVEVRLKPATFYSLEFEDGLAFIRPYDCCGG